MVQTPVPSPLRPAAIAPDNLQIHRDRSWGQFKLIQQGLDDAAGVRLCFFQGIIEVLMPGRYHELFKKMIASLLEAFLLDHEIAATPTGSVNHETEGRAAAQPDESYEIGTSKLVVEVIVTSGAIAKLDLYRILGVDEVWFWEDGSLKLYHLTNGEFQLVEQSQIPELAPLKIAVLKQCIVMGETNWNQAVKVFRAAHPVGSA